MTSPSTFILVHGAWMGGWAWSRIKPLLEDRGHQVYSPTLTGLAERASLISKDVNLSTHVDDITRLLIAGDLQDAVLVGHSYGGMVVSGVADKMPERVKALVVLDGFVPESGKAMREYWPASIMTHLDKEASISGGVSVPPLPAQSLAVEKENREWVDRQTTPQPYGTFNEVIRLTGARDAIAKKSYIRALKFRSHPFDAFVKKLESDPGWRALTIESGHVPMVDDPASLAELLGQMA